MDVLYVTELEPWLLHKSEYWCSKVWVWMQWIWGRFPECAGMSGTEARRHGVCPSRTRPHMKAVSFLRRIVRTGCCPGNNMYRRSNGSNDGSPPVARMPSC